MSSEKGSGDDESELPLGNVKIKTDKKKNRKLSWQEPPKAKQPDNISLEEIKVENKLENRSPNQRTHGSISDGELVEKEKEKRAKVRERRSNLKRGKSVDNVNLRSAAFRSHRRFKSLIRFEPNNYTLKEIKALHERMTARMTKPSKCSFCFCSTFTKEQNLLLACLCLVDFASFCSMSVMAPFFTKEAKKKGMSETTSGFVFSFYALVVFLSSPLVGKLLPQVGARFLFLSGLFINCTCSFLFGLLGFIKVDLTFTVFCFLVEGVGALGASAYCTAAYVFVAKIFPSNIGSVSGLMETFVGLGMSIGPALGGFFYHIGGFGLPFFALGTFLSCTFLVALWVLPVVEGGSSNKTLGSFLNIVTEPTVTVIGLVIVLTASVWAFLDPTLEPHLRQFNLTPEKVGLVFFLFSALYGLSSPFWGILSDKTGNHWLLMTSGLLLSTVGLLLLGPAPFISFLPSDLWLNLIALAILGVSISLSLIPTFQGLLSSIAVSKGDSEYNFSIYAVVASLWPCFYALGEVIGPLIGGVMTEHYGFPTCCTVLAAATFTLSIGSFIYFAVRDCLSDRGENYRYKFEDSEGYESDQSDYSDDPSKPILQNNYHNRLYTEGNAV